MLEEQQLKRYTACYCGLCRSLKQRHGELSRLTLNYDMTLLVLMLGRWNVVVILGNTLGHVRENVPLDLAIEVNKPVRSAG